MGKVSASRHGHVVAAALETETAAGGVIEEFAAVAACGP